MVGCFRRANIPAAILVLPAHKPLYADAQLVRQVRFQSGVFDLQFAQCSDREQIRQKTAHRLFIALIRIMVEIVQTVHHSAGQTRFNGNKHLTGARSCLRKIDHFQDAFRLEQIPVVATVSGDSYRLLTGNVQYEPRHPVIPFTIVTWQRWKRRR